MDQLDNVSGWLWGSFLLAQVPKNSDHGDSGTAEPGLRPFHSVWARRDGHQA
jgi:hypothetical protein